MPCSLSFSVCVCVPCLSLSYYLSSLSLTPHALCLCLCLCNAGIAASRSIWVSFVHVHLVHTHPYLGLGRADAAQSEASSVQDGFLTHKWLGLAWFCDNLQAHLTPLMRRLGNKPSLFLRFLLALFTDSHAKFSASSSGARRQIVIPDYLLCLPNSGRTIGRRSSSAAWRPTSISAWRITKTT